MHRLAALTLAAAFVVAQAPPAAAAPGDVHGARGRVVSPRAVQFGALPRITGPQAGPAREHAEGVNPEVDAERDRQKRHPHAIAPADFRQFTLDPGAPLAPGAGTGFEGITQAGYIPGEPTVAAGPLNVFSCGNVSVTVTNKDGSNRAETSGRTFFGVTPGEGDISDPQCYFDALRGRFVALCFTEGKSGSTQWSNFYLAISQSSDARGAWWLYKFDQTLDGSTPTSNWSDYEGLGVSDDKLAMSSQQFAFSGNSYQYQKIR